MRKILWSLLVAVMFAAEPAVVHGQNPPKEPRDAPQNEVRLKTQLVEVIAVVTSKQGRPVTGLSKEDFDVRENGRTQEVSFFSSASDANGPSRQQQPLAARPGEVSVPPQTTPQRTVVIFVDSFNMSQENLIRAKVALHRFVDEKLTDQDMAAIVASSGSLGLLAEFTRDKAVLHYAIERLGSARVTSRSQFTPYLAARLIAGDPLALNLAIAIVLKEDRLENLDPVVVTREFLANYATNKAFAVIADAGYPRRVTLKMLKAVVERLASLPGQRMMAILSDGFTLRDRSGNIDSSDLEEVLSKAGRSGTVIDSIFAGGLEGPPAFETSQGGVATIDSRTQSVNTSALSALYQAGAVEDAKDVLNAVAKDTGGEFFANTNDILGALQSGLESNRVYYTLGYYPSNVKDEKKFRNITVKVRTHPEYVVRCQKGYFPSDSVKELEPDRPATPEQQ
ncbi:MAG TPA: VWA domain-containing protein, partial [Blastocatellia bacterium]|nr:VWA domain-containing protein [Blastocatellia bacterium]